LPSLYLLNVLKNSLLSTIYLLGIDLERGAI